MKLVWEDDWATLPDGRRVALMSEQVRGEPRYYAPHVMGERTRPRQLAAMPSFPGDERYDGGTKAKAKRWAQAYADYLEENR